MSEYPFFCVNSIHKNEQHHVCPYYQLCFEGQFRSHRMEDGTVRLKKVAAFSAAATCFSYYANVSVLIKFP